MSPIPSSNGRVLQPEIPLPSSQPSNPPRPMPLPLDLIPVADGNQGGPSQNALQWFLRKNHQPRASPKNASSKRGAVRAPPLDRSWSEPNSPTDPTSAGFTGRGDMIDYVARSRRLLDDCKCQFAGTLSASIWEALNNRHHQLFTKERENIHGKLVKPGSLKPGAQMAAKLIWEELQEAAGRTDDLEDFPDPSTIPQDPEIEASTEAQVVAHRKRSFTPDLTPRKPTTSPWFDLRSVNPAILDNVDKHRSIHPEGTWHGHSRSRSAVPSRPTIPDFVSHRSREVMKADPASGHVSREDLRETRNGYPSSKDRIIPEPMREMDSRVKEFDRDGKGKETERSHRRDRDRARDRDRRYESEGERHRERDTGLSRELTRGRGDRSRSQRDNPPPLEYSYPDKPSRERQVSDPAVYTRSSHKRDASPESLAPAIYTLPEDVEVSLGTSSTTSATASGGRTTPVVGVPRVPTMLTYPGSTYEDQLASAFGMMTPNLRAGPSAQNDRWAPPVSAPLAPVAEVPSSAGASESTATQTHRRRRRSRSLGHEIDGRANRERPRSRSPRDRPRGKDYERDRERDRYKDRGRVRDDGGRQGDRDRERDRDGERDRERDRDRDRDREKNKEKDKERRKDKDRDRDRQRDRERDRDRRKELDGERESDKERYREKDRDRERDRDRDLYGSSRSKYPEEERDRRDSGRRSRNREHDKDRDREQERERDRDRERNRTKDKDKKREKDHDRDKDRDRDRDRDRNKDRDRRDHRNDRSDRDRERAIPPNSAPLPATNDVYPTASMPGAYHDGPIQPESTSSGPAGVHLEQPHQRRLPLPQDMMRHYNLPMDGPCPLPNMETRFQEQLETPVPQQYYGLPLNQP